MPMNWNEPPSHLEGEGPWDDPFFICERCDRECSELHDACVQPLSFSGPAEYERWCSHCMGPDVDERDREPDEDALEAWRNR